MASGQNRIPSRRRPASPFQAFLEFQALSGVALVLFAAAALLWANGPWAQGYFGLREMPVGVWIGSSGLERTLLHWINDGLMALFFLLVGLEIKREVLVGELASPRLAALPIVAAVGGMAVPALIYLAFNWGTPGARGWGIPMATDIAFSIGVLALLGKRVPVAIRIFLTAFAIVDDMGAVLVIAVFYTDQVGSASLAGAGATFAALLAMNKLGVRRLTPYLAAGAILWFFLLQSGVHASVAGVLVAMAVPTLVRLDPAAFARASRDLIDQFEAGEEEGVDVILSESRQACVGEIERNCEDAQMPLQRLEHALHPLVNFGVMPVFALANAGVAVSAVESATGGVSAGIAAGLVIGKPVGILLACAIAVRLGWARLPTGVAWGHVAGAGLLGGIGFTMSLFIGGLAFADPSTLDQAKVGILTGSLASALLGAIVLVVVHRRRPA